MWLYADAKSEGPGEANVRKKPACSAKKKEGKKHPGLMGVKGESQEQGEQKRRDRKWREGSKKTAPPDRVGGAVFRPGECDNENSRQDKSPRETSDAPEEKQVTYMIKPEAVPKRSLVVSLRKNNQTEKRKKRAHRGLPFPAAEQRRT